MNTASKINVLGDPDAVDSFAACLSAVMQAWAKNADYATIEALTGLAFSPCYNKSEECVGWMMDGESAHRIDFIGRALGFAAERHELSEPLEGADVEAYRASGTLPLCAQVYFDRIHQSMVQGKMILVETWPAWSVLTGWNEDLTQLPFSTTPGFEPVVSRIYPPIRARTSFILTNTSSVADPAQICRETIRFGADIASGKIALAQNTFGGAMYETIVSVSRQEHMCPGCQESGCLGRTFKRMHDGQQASIAFLSAAGPFIDGPENNKRLNTAIGYYSELRDLTAGYLDWASTEKKRDQPAFRRQLADDFTRAKALHDAAAEQLLSLAASI